MQNKNEKTIIKNKSFVANGIKNVVDPNVEIIIKNVDGEERFLQQDIIGNVLLLELDNLEERKNVADILKYVMV